MSSTTPRTTSYGRRRSPRRPTSRLTASLGAVGLALALAACGSDEPDTAEELAAEASEAGVPQALQDYAETLGEDADVPTQEEAQDAFDEWLEGKSSGSDPSGDDDTSTGTGSGTSGPSPAVGDCLEHLPLGAEDTDAEAPIGDCAAEHAAEIYSVVELGDLGPEYPAPTVLFDAANERCGDAYLERFGGPVIDTGITFGHVGPTHDTWDAGDTDLYCYAYPVGLETYSGELKAENR